MSPVIGLMTMRYQIFALDLKLFQALPIRLLVQINTRCLMSPNTALRQYQTVNVQAQVLAADPYQLIQMLFQGGLTRLAQARGAIEHGQVALKGESIGKAIGIIGGLREALDHKKGGEIAANLDRLYEYMVNQLSKANRSNDIAIIDEVVSLLREVKSGWDAIAP